MISDTQIFDACKSVLDSEKRPLEIRRVADTCGMPEEDVIAALIRATSERGSITFRYPPIPRAAIKSIP